MKDNGVWVRAMAMFSFVVTDLVATTGSGLLLGWFLVTKAEWPSWVYLPTTMLGFSLGIYRVYRRSQQVNREEP